MDNSLIKKITTTENNIDTPFLSPCPIDRKDRSQEKGIVDYALSFPFPSLATGTQPRPEGVTRLLLENLWQKKGKKVAVQLLLIDYPGNSRGSEESRPTSVSFRNQLRAVL